MATVICSQCAKSVESDGELPLRCPHCGNTFGIGNDSTGREAQQLELPQTVIESRSAMSRKIGKYEIRSELGSGAFGTVFLARDPELNRFVAIKVPRVSFVKQREILQRFAREARNAAQLIHPGIVTLHAVEHDSDVVFIVCEYIDGESLSSRIERGPVSFLEAATLVASVAEAVDYAHSKRVIHRDIKPANILIGSDGKPRLTDFGLAKQLTIDETITLDNQVMGTPAYMSPEQASADHGEVDSRTDVYSLGIVLYQLLAERLPFRGDKRFILHQVIGIDAPRLRSINNRIPQDLETVCHKAIEKNPVRRYQSAGDLASDLRRWLRGEPIVARHIGRAERAWRWCQRNPLTAALLSSIAVLLVATTVISVAMYAAEARAVQAKDDALQAEAKSREQETTLRLQIEESARKDRERLSRAYVEKADRHLRPGPDLSEYSPLRALPWLYAALEVDEQNPARRDAARIRLQSQLDFAPRVEQMWFRGGGITAGCVSPLGDLLAAGGRDGQIHLWNITSDAPLSRPLVHASLVSITVFSPDGKWLATGAEDGVRVWETNGGKLHAGPWHPLVNAKGVPVQERVDQIRFSKSGQWLVASLRDTSQVWNVATGEKAGPALVAGSAIGHVEFSESERSLVTSAGRDAESVRAWDFISGVDRRGATEAETNRLPVVATWRAGSVGLDGRPDDGRVELWRSGTGDSVGAPIVHPVAIVTNVGFSPDRRLIATAASDGVIRMWDVETGQLRWQRQYFVGQSARLLFSLDRSVLAVVHPFRGIAVVDVDSGQLVAQPIRAETRLAFVDWAAGGKLVAAGDDGAIRLWSLESREPLFQCPNEQHFVHAVVSEDRRTIAASDSEGGCFLMRCGPDGRFDRDSVQLLSHDLSAELLALTHDGSKLAVANDLDRRGAAVTIFDTATRQAIGNPLPHSAAIRALRFTPDGEWLVCLTRNEQLTVWNVKTQLTPYQPIPVAGLCWSLDLAADGTRCAVASGNEVRVFDLATGQRTGPPISHDKFSPLCRFFRDSRRLVTGDAAGRASVWEIATARLMGATSVDAMHLTCLDVAADDSVFLTGSASGTARLWSARDAAPASRALEHYPSNPEFQPEILQGAIDPRGRWIVTVAGRKTVVPPTDSQVHLWDATTGEILLVRNLRHIQSRLAMLVQDGATSPSAVVLAWFAADGRRLHILGETGALVTMDLESDSRSLKELQNEIAIRSGVVFDSVGGLKRLSSDEMNAVWQQRRKSP